MNKKCIFTYITGNYDNLMNPNVITPGWDYICFTDNKSISSDVWDIKPIHDKDLSVYCPKRRANSVVMKYYEYIPDHYDICICIDGNLKIHKNLNELLSEFNYDLNEHDLMIPNHPDRSCVYEEAKAIINLNKDTRSNTESHVQKLKAEKYPANNGLYETCAMVLNRKSPLLKELFKDWYKEYMRLPCKRDQMSLNYVIWKYSNGINILSHSAPPEAKGKDRRAFSKYFETIKHPKRNK